MNQSIGKPVNCASDLLFPFSVEDLTFVFRETRPAKNNRNRRRFDAPLTKKSEGLGYEKIKLIRVFCAAVNRRAFCMRMRESAKRQ